MVNPREGVGELLRGFVAEGEGMFDGVLQGLDGGVGGEGIEVSVEIISTFVVQESGPEYGEGTVGGHDGLCAAFAEELMVEPREAQRVVPVWWGSVSLARGAEVAKREEG